MDAIKNYYEEIVRSKLECSSINLSDNEILDVLCIALNSLPCRYYRCSISMSHHNSIETEESLKEKEVLNKRIDKAINHAIRVVRESPRDREY